MLSYTLKVVAVKNETPDTVTICFKQPGLKPVKYLAGQYLTLVFRINGRRYIRPYSFSSSPGIDKTLNITVKRMYGGIVSNHIVDKVKVDDLVEVIKPMGDFILPQNEDLSGKNLVLWGTGSGITPLLSIIKYSLHHQLFKKVMLVYGNRDHKTTIFLEELKSLEKQYEGIFSVWHFHTQAVLENTNAYVKQGRIAPEIILKTLDAQGDLNDTLHFICGPIGLKDSIRATLEGAGINSKNVFSEDFEVYRDPKDFENIVTQTISITNNGQKSEIEVSKGKSILEAGLDAGLELSYSCQTGNCLLCKARLVEGEVKMINVKDVEGIAEAEYLLCCSFPLTSNVNIIIE